MAERDFRSLVSNLQRRKEQRVAALNAQHRRLMGMEARELVAKVVPPKPAPVAAVATPWAPPVCDTCGYIGGDHHRRCKTVRHVWNGVSWWLFCVAVVAAGFFACKALIA